MSTPQDQVGAVAAVDSGISQAARESPDPKAEATQLEIDQVKTAWNEYERASVFDRNARKGYERDRRSAAGTSDVSYAVDANLLGSYLDILVSYIYSRNPKVSVRPAEQCEIVYNVPLIPGDAQGAITQYQTQEARRKISTEMQAFAKTLQIVIGRLWKDGKLKKCMKKVVRSGFTVGVGWFKASLLFDTKTDPVMQQAVNDIRDNLARIDKLHDDIAAEELVGAGVHSREELVAKLQSEMQGLEEQVEIVLRKALAIDFCAAEHMQAALDVRELDDYCDGSWMANATFKLVSDARAEFPDVSEDDWKTAITYAQKEPEDLKAIVPLSSDQNPEPPAEAAQYIKSGIGVGTSTSSTIGDGKPEQYVKIVEKWDRRDSSIKTMIEGMKRWPKLPFSPRFSTSRYFPYFLVQFFPVDGERHPQSMAWRLSKLQEEYANSRSNFRLTRQRSIPGVLFNATQIDSENAKKLADGTQGEYIGLSPLDPERPMRDLFTEKPLPRIDPAIFDNAMIIGDMEKLSGVQEALQTSQTIEKTATQANIEQGGFAARTTAQRDSVEEALTDFAQYTAELALQGFTYDEVSKMAGNLAFWPEGMSRDAVTQYLNVDIEAGSTGRPNTQAERQAWAEIMPQIRETIGLVLAARAQGMEEIARVYIELLRETLTRYDDRLDVERFIPVMPPNPALLGAAGGGGGEPGAQPGGPPAPGAPPGGAPPGGGGGGPSKPATIQTAADGPGSTDPLKVAA